jgi:hypothetical protein
VTQPASIQQKEKMSERAAKPGIAAGGHLPEDSRRAEGVKRSLSTTHRTTPQARPRLFGRFSLHCWVHGEG